MGSVLAAMFESLGSTVAPDDGDFMLGDAIDAGLADSVNDNDAKFPPEFRLSKSNRENHEKEDQSCRHWTGTPSSICPWGSPVPTARNSSPTAAPRWSKSNRQKGIRFVAGRHRAPTSQVGEDGALFSYLACTKHSVVVDPQDADDVDLLTRLLASADAVVWSRGSAIAAVDEFTPAALAVTLPASDGHSITPFGLEGPWSGQTRHRIHRCRRGRAGSIGLGRGSADRPPLLRRRVRSANGSQVLMPRRGRWHPVQRRTGRRVDARGRDPLPHLLSGDIQDARHGRGAMSAG